MLSTRSCYRWVSASVLLALALALPLSYADARHVMPDLVNVPVARLIRNLGTLARNDSKNVEVRFNLARAHAMAYALKTETAQVWKGKENEGVWFGYEASHIPFTVQPAANNFKLKAAKEHLSEAIKHYARVIEMAPDNLAAALGYAWCIEQSG